MIQFKAILFQNGTDNPFAPINQILVNDLLDSHLIRSGIGNYQIISDSFTSDAIVFLPLYTADGRTPLIPIFDGGAITGYVAISYGYEDFGAVYIKTYNTSFEAADGILDNFPVSVELRYP